MSEFSVYRSYTPGGRTSKTFKEQEKTETKERKRNLLYLISGYLRERNLHDSADALNVEAQLTNQYELCDNIDLDIIFQDYESYYFTKFNKMPKITKKIASEAGALEVPTHKRKTRSIHTAQNATDVLKVFNRENISTPAEGFQIDVTGLSQKTEPTPVESYAHESPGYSNKLNSKALCDFKGYSSEWREMADLILKEVVPKSLGVTWSDCIGLGDTIELLKEIVVYPVRHPELFTGLATPWRGVLLYGPPGTGKTHLAKAVASESNSRFINVRSSSFISKWRGESEKMLKVLFDVAKFYEPTTIFIDEVDAIASRYESAQHDASRRFKSELLIQMDGVLNGDEQVFVLATTNAPWNLDPAILRRFEKRLLLNAPPSADSRRELFKYFFSKHGNDFQESDFKRMGELTDHFTGSDIKLICKEVIMDILREKMGKPDGARGNKKEFGMRKPSLNDVIKAIGKANATTKMESVQKYNEWQRNFGCR